MKIKTIYSPEITSFAFKEGKVGLVEVERDLEIKEPDDLIIRGKMCGFCKSDIETLMGKNNVPVESFGHEGVGIVEKVGPGVKTVKEGDFVATYGDGCYGDFYRVKAYQVAKVKDFSCNAIVQPLATMLNVADLVPLKGPVLVNGCGSNALLLAKIFNYERRKFDFIGEHNVERMEALGGYHSSRIKVRINERYNTVIEISGKQGAYSLIIDFLKDEGDLLAAANPEEPELIDLFKYSWKAITVYFPSPRNFSFKWSFKSAALLLNEGHIKLDDIFDKCYNRNNEQELQQAVEDKVTHKVTKGYLVW